MKTHSMFVPDTKRNEFESVINKYEKEDKRERSNEANNVKNSNNSNNSSKNNKPEKETIEVEDNEVYVVLDDPMDDDVVPLATRVGKRLRQDLFKTNESIPFQIA